MREAYAVLRFMFSIAVAFLVLCIAGKMAFGQNFGGELQLVAIPGYRAVDDIQALQIYGRASYYFKEVGLTFRIRYIKRADNPCWLYHNWTVRGLELDCFKEDAKVQGYRRKRVLTYYMLPPWIVVNEAFGPQTAWIAGIAESIGGTLALGNATPNQLENGVEGPPRIDHSAVILAHEVLHLKHAKHVDSSPNLMHSNANFYTTEYNGRLPVHRITKRQVRRWYAKIRKY